MFRPGEPSPSGNVFANWAALVAALPMVPGWKTIQFDGSLIFPANIVIPTGIWDMTETEWFGFSNPTNVLPPQRYVVETNDSQFPNLRAISGEIQINNTNTSVPMITLPATGQQIELGAGAMGAFPIINNIGTRPFVDASALTGGAQFLLRMTATIQGTSPAIDFGALTGFRFIFGLFDQSVINAGMIVGTNPACNGTAIVHASANMGYQPGFAGVITKGSGAGVNASIGLVRMYYSPYSPFPNVPIAPSPVDITVAAGLGMNSALRLDTTAGDVTQTLPLIRSNAPGFLNPGNAGVGDSTGLFVIVKNQVGNNDVNVVPNTTEAPPDTIEGGAGPVVIPPGESRIFMSDGSTNWIVVATADVHGPTYGLGPVNQGILQPSFVSPEQTVTIYARPGGNDATGNGSLGNPYATLQRAVRDVPAVTPPGVRYTVDVTGVTEVLPIDYELPTWKTPEIIGYDPTDPYFLFQAAIQIEAVPQLVAAIPPADATVAFGDITGQTIDPDTGLLTITIGVARASWGGNALKGKFVVLDPLGDPNPAANNCTILESTTTTLLVGKTSALIAGFTIREPSAWFQVTSIPNANATRGGLNCYNCDSIAFNGLKITSTTGGQAFGLMCNGAGQTMAQMCELDRPQFSSSAPGISRVFNAWIYGARFRGTALLVLADVLFENIGTWALLNMFFLHMTRCKISGGVTLETVAQAPGSSRFADIVPTIRLENMILSGIVTPAATADGFRFNGGKAQLDQVVINGCGRDGIRCQDDVGFLILNNVRSQVPNGTTVPSGVGIFVNDGVQVKVDAATSNPIGTILTGAGGDMKVGTLPVRTWADFVANQPIKNEYDLRLPFVTNALSGLDVPGGDETTGPGTGGCSGSRLFQRT